MVAVATQRFENTTLAEENFTSASGRRATVTKPSPLDEIEPLEQRVSLVGGELRRYEGRQEVYSVLKAPTENGMKPIYLGCHPKMTAAEALEALRCAEKAHDQGLGAWAMMSLEERITRVERFISMILPLRETVARGLMDEIQKPWTDALKEFDRTISFMRDAIEEARKLEREGNSVLTAEGSIATSKRAPVGIALVMGPYNYALNEDFTVRIPILLQGNVVVVKLPKLGVLLHEPMLKAFQECFPPGVVNVVYGDGAEIISPIMQSGKVNLLAFIGSDRVADAIIKQHPEPKRLRYVLGLGAKNIAVVTKDADLKNAAKEITKGAFSNGGRRCTAISQVFVEESVQEEFLTYLKAEVEAIKTDYAWVPGVMNTPLPEPGKAEELTRILLDARAGGARVINEGGGRVESPFFTPALLFPIKEGMELYHKEPFGPMLGASSYRDEEAIVEYLKKSDYGQQASLFTSKPAEHEWLSSRLEMLTARVNLNKQCARSPEIIGFTGRKNSGIGLVSVRDTLLEASTVKQRVAPEGDPAAAQFLAKA